MQCSKTPHIYNYTHTHSDAHAVLHKASQSVTKPLRCMLQESALWHAYMNMQPKTGRTKRDKGFIYRATQGENTAGFPYVLPSAHSQRQRRNETEVDKDCLWKRIVLYSSCRWKWTGFPPFISDSYQGCFFVYLITVWMWEKSRLIPMLWFRFLSNVNI